nr:endolytic transglycosylase MltG [Candidatus Enterousia merdequi]
MKKISKKQLRVIKDWVKFALAILCVIFFVVYFIFNLWSPLKEDAYMIVKPGTSVSSVTNYMLKNNIIKSGDLFYFSIQMNGGKIMAGEYEIPRGAGVWTIASMLANGRIATTVVTIPEGFTIKQTKNLLMNITTLTGEVDCDKQIPICNLRDGDIFPDTYRIARGMSRLAVLELAHKKMQEVKNSFEGVVYPTPLKDWNDVMVLASIVQKETPLKREMPIVAGVYLNRLNTNMRLQACPTVIYALTDFEGNMHGESLLSEHLKIDSPYNTYIHKGLPPYPIANVGVDAIRAVLNPSKTDYLFFVADGRGGHKFSKTYDEHQKYHEKWREIKKNLNK